MKKKICIIVDNPSRDLKGILLLSLNLIESYDVYLIEQYNKREIYLINPDVIIFQTARINNIKDIRNCNKLGASICVLGSEGGYDSYGILTQTNKEISKNLKYINNLFCWGKFEFEKLKKKTKKDFLKKLLLTGSPKSDLLYFYKNFYKKKKIKKNIDILFNTSFPLTDPRYGNFQKTYSSFKKDLQYINKRKIENLFKQLNENQLNFKKLIQRVSKIYHKKKIAIRIHPFENKSSYKQLFTKIKNIEIISDNEAIFETLIRSKHLIHYNCTTSFEYMYLNNKKSLMPNYFKKYLNYGKSISYSSVLCNSFSKLENNLKKINKNSKKNKIKVNNSIENIFWKLDGKSCRRISNIIKKYKNNDEKNYDLLLRNFTTTENFRQKLILFFYYINPLLYRKLRNLFFPNKIRGKEIAITKINQEILLLKKIMNYKKKINIRLLDESDIVLNYVKGGFGFKLFN